MALYDASKEAKRYLDFYAEPNSKNECEHFKHIIRQEFFPTRGLPKDPSKGYIRFQENETATLRFGRPHAVLHRNGL